MYGMHMLIVTCVWGENEGIARRGPEVLEQTATAYLPTVIHTAVPIHQQQYDVHAQLHPPDSLRTSERQLQRNILAIFQFAPANNHNQARVERPPRRSSLKSKARATTNSSPAL